MVQFTLDNLQEIMPSADDKRLEIALPYINDTLTKFSIYLPLRAAAFIAQLAHESGQLRYYEELASGKAYEGRKNLGNTVKGDGVRFKGRGPIQITGRFSYQAFSVYTGHDFINNPKDLALPEWGFLAAGWFWDVHSKPSLNTFADQRRFKHITKVINGGYNGWEDRKMFYYRACQALGMNRKDCEILDD